jgi:cAMP phosphodiesterase
VPRSLPFLRLTGSLSADVEPDSISLDPRNRRVWEEVACRFRAGILDSVFVSQFPCSLSPASARLTLARLAQIECSYDNSRPDELLYGHLCPRHVLAELAVLHELLEPTRSRPSGSAGAGLIDEPLSARLRGLRVHIIHVKETLEALTTDGGGIRGRVLRELEEGKQFFERGILSEVEFKVVKRGELLSASCS